MAMTNPRQVTAGYFRINSYVLLGLLALATLVSREFLSVDETISIAIGAALAYIASVVWLYQISRAGRVFLAFIAMIALFAAWQASLPTTDVTSGSGANLWLLDSISGGLVLGATMAAMLLGHWYLNAPGMQLAPLRRLVVIIVIAVVLRVFVSGAGFLMFYKYAMGLELPSTSMLLFLTLRWLAGLVAPLGLAYMTWKTLDIPNTQSATGILYVMVIVTFIGELSALLISENSMYPF